MSSPPHESKSLPSNESEGAAGREAVAVHVVLVVTQVAFASLAVEGNLVMTRYGVSPYALAMARIAGGALLFGIAHIALGTPRVRSLRDVAELLSLSVFGIVVNQALFLAGLQRTTPISATLLIATIPVFAVAIGAITGRDRMTGRHAAGIALALAGVLTLTGFAVPAAGDALVLANSLSYAIYVVFAKRALERYGAVTVMAWVFGLGALLFAPFGGARLVADAPSWSTPAVLLTAYIVAVPTALGYGASAWALRRAPPSLVVVYVYLQPLVVAALAWIQLGQPVAPRAAGAAILIFAGVTLVGTATRRRVK